MTVGDGRLGSAFGPLTVIVDGLAGRGSVAARVPEVRAALHSRGLPHELHVTSSAADATDVARRAMKDGGRFVVAVGNDGSVQAVVNGLFEDGTTIADLPVLGVVGADAGCDLLRTFGLPDDVEGGVHHLTGDATYPLDLMKVTFTSTGGERVTRYAHNLAEVGLGGAIHLRAERLPGGTGRVATRDAAPASPPPATLRTGLKPWRTAPLTVEWRGRAPWFLYDSDAMPLLLALVCGTFALAQTAAQLRMG